MTRGLPGTAVTHLAITPTDDVRVVSIGDVGHLSDDLVTGHLP